MRRTLNSVFRIRTRINNDNIKKYIIYYITNKEKLPWDLKDKQIGDWDVSRVTNMSSMFSSLTNFNEPLNDWNVSNVTNMRLMFNSCYSFNQSLNNWNVSNVTNMDYMFYNCTNFNQPLNNWNINPRASTANMFFGCIIEENYKPVLPVLPPPPPPIQVDAHQVHKAASKIKYSELNKFLLEKTEYPLPNNLNFSNYINDTINRINNESDEP
jgi:surface protein